MYPDSILFVILPVALYAGLVFVPHHIGRRASGIALGATAVFLLASISMQNSPSFDFSKEYPIVVRSWAFRCNCGCIFVSFRGRHRPRRWLRRAICLGIGVGVTAVIAILLIEFVL